MTYWASGLNGSMAIYIYIYIYRVSVRPGMPLCHAQTKVRLLRCYSVLGARVHLLLHVPLAIWMVKERLLQAT